MTNGGDQRERKGASIQETEDLLVLAQEAGNFGIFEWWVQTGAVILSPMLQQLFGVRDFDGSYESWRGFVFREDLVHLEHSIDEALAAHAEDMTIEFRIVKQDDGTIRWLERRSVVFYDREGRPERLVGISVDVTERKRATAQLHALAETLEERVRERTRELEEENKARMQAEETLRQAQKMEAVGQLTGGVAHDFNNLLTIIMGGLELIGRQMPFLPASSSVQRIGRARDMAVKGAERAALLTQRLLAFSRQQPLSAQAVDANKLVSGVSDLLQRTIGEAVSLETALADELWLSHADPNQLENALVNLAVNARDAMPDGGKLTIETANCYLDERYVRALAEPVEPGQYVMIAVADTGTGMDAKTAERAFDPFFTTKEAGKGTGLGLSQVYGFVRQSAGHVRIYSERGEGTTVKIYLPRSRGTRSGIGATSRTRNMGITHGAECILVVEDDEVLLAYTAGILGEFGYTILESRDGRGALRLLEGQHVDLLLTDIVMPGGMNGRQLADEAQLRRPALKVLFMTGYTPDGVIHQGRLDAAVQMIGKPFSIDGLASKVREVLDTNA